MAILGGIECGFWASVSMVLGTICSIKIVGFGRDLES